MSSMKVAMMHFVQHKYIVHIGLEIKKTHKIPKTNQFHGKKRKYIFTKKKFREFWICTFLKTFMALCKLIVFGAWEYHDLPICHLKKKKMKMVYG